MGDGEVTNPNWGLMGQQPNALSMFQVGAQMGTQKRQEAEQREQQNAMLQMRQKELDARLQTEQTAAAEKANTQRRVGMVDVAKLFRGVTPENYGQRVQIAQQMGLDVSKAPQAYDPNWVQQNAAIIDAFVDKEDQLPGIVQELQAAGLDMNTDAGKQALQRALEGKYGSEYYDQATGQVRKQRVFQLGNGGQAVAPAAPPPAAVAELRANPASKAQFDEIFGPGTADRVLGQGGGDQGVTGNFLDGLQL